MSFTFRQLEIFAEAAKDGNFRRTADRIGVSQPAISKHVRALEAGLGQSLFTRFRGSSSRLSPEGELLLGRVRAMLAEHRALAASDRSSRRLLLRVAAGDYLLNQVLKPLLPEFGLVCPDIELQFHTGIEPRGMMGVIQSGDVDLALYTGRQPASAQPTSEVLAVIRCSIFGEKELVSRISDDRDAISSAPFVLPSDAATAAGVLRMLANAGITPNNVVARTQFGDVLPRFVESGRCIGVMFDEAEPAAGDSGSRLARVPINIGSVYRVMLIGARAQLTAAAAALDFFRRRLGSLDGAIAEPAA
jgi:DNA-binding transcriptional LysR family regulator